MIYIMLKPNLENVYSWMNIIEYKLHSNRLQLEQENPPHHTCTCQGRRTLLDS
jgi:hypothetical protein